MLRVERPGETVSCPHCGIVLQSPKLAVDPLAADPRSAEQVDFTLHPNAGDFAPLNSGATTLNLMRGPLAGMDFPESPVAASPPGRQASTAAPGPSTQSPAFESRAPETTASAARQRSDLPRFAPASAPAASRVPVVVASSPQDSASEPKDVLPRSSSLAYRLVLSYASAVTLVCVYLSYLLSTRASCLDLPDLAPPAKKGNKTTRLLHVPPGERLPDANILALGESRRYGSIRVTPLRVTRGSLKFTFFDAQAGEQRDPSGPVLKLHLLLENVSSDQQFMPLDRQLVFTKEPDPREFGHFKANNFVSPRDLRHDRHRLVYVYDISPDSPWLIANDNIDRELAPGESIEAFVPTAEEGLESLTGELVWRVHLRKGYNRESYRGVTTLIDVLFRDEEITNE